MGIRYAFDLGTNSIGAAVWRTGPDPAGIFGPDAPLELLWSGVRLFKDGRNPKDQQSLAVMRRIPRQSRKRRDRFVLRRADLMRALVEIGLMPSAAEARKRLESLDPYELRAAALDRALTPHEIGRVLFHLNQRRGFKSNRKTDKADKDKGKIATASAKLSDALREQNCRTFGEFLLTRHRGDHHDPRRVRDPGRQSTRIRIEGEGAKALYEFYPTRAMIRREFDEIWREQASHHPALLTDARRNAIGAIMFRQRDLKPPKIGKCTFEPTEERLPKALPSVEARELYERLAHVRVTAGSIEDRPLLPEQRDALASALLAGANLTFKKIQKDLKLGGNARINFEEAGEKELKGCLTGKLLSKDNHYGRRWLGLSWAQKDAFVAKLLEEADEATLEARLIREDGLSAEAAHECATIPLADGYSRLGATANAAILEALIDERDARGFVVPYSEAVLRAGARLGRDWHHSDERDGEIFPRLPYYGQVLQRHVLPGSMDEKDKEKGDEPAYWGRLMNPTVHIGLNQLRRIINLMIARFGAPDQIVVELARELKLNAEQKEKEQKRNRDNRAANEKRVLKLGEIGVPDNGEARARLKLFEEQQAAGDGVALCPFSGFPIGVEQLFTSDIEIEHILPRSRTLDDSPANKVLCYRNMNRIKRGKSPFEAFGHTPQWEDIAARAEKLPSNRRWRFKPDAMEKFEKDGGFLQRQLNETKYLSRLAKAYLGKICDPDHVYVTPGTLTGLLRGKWGLNSLLSDDNRKNRTDHRHHAIDAIVIGAMTRALIQYLSREAGRAEATEYDAILGKIAPPFENLRDVVRTSVERLIVSNKPEHSRSGALHKDTAYGLVADPAEAKKIGNLVSRKPVTDLTTGEVDSIRDPILRRRLQAAVEAFRDAKGKVKDEKGFKAALTTFATTTLPHGKVIRRIRVGKTESRIVPIANGRTDRPYKWVLSEENHHADLVSMRDGSWKFYWATSFDVNLKGWRPEWEVQRLGGKLLMRLHKGDYVKVSKEGDATSSLLVVHQLDAGNDRLFAADPNEGGGLEKRRKDKDDPFQWTQLTASKLKQWNAVAVRIDEIGNAVNIRSNIS